MRDGQIEVGFVHKGLDEFMHKLDVAFNRLVIALIITGGLIGSSLIGILATDGPHLFGLHFLSVIGFVLSVPFDLPTGPAIICISGLLALLAWGVRRLRG